MDGDDLIFWEGPGYPPALRPLLNRFQPPFAPTILVGQGWWPLLVETDAALGVIDAGYRLTQVYEELGDLALYAATNIGGAESSAFTELANEAMRRAARTCEVCGQRGRLVRQGTFFIVLCWDHADERGAVPARDGDDLDLVVPRLTGADTTAAIASGEPPRAYTRRGHADAVAWAQRQRLAIDEEMASWFTTADMANVLGVSADAVRHLLHAERICAARRHNGNWAYPRWQLDADENLVRGLGDVLAAFAPGYDALAITHVLTTPAERFDGGSALDWLDGGGSIDAVVRYVSGLR